MNITVKMFDGDSAVEASATSLHVRFPYSDEVFHVHAVDVYYGSSLDESSLSGDWKGWYIGIDDSGETTLFDHKPRYDGEGWIQAHHTGRGCWKIGIGVNTDRDDPTLSFVVEVDDDISSSKFQELTLFKVTDIMVADQSTHITAERIVEFIEDKVLAIQYAPVSGMYIVDMLVGNDQYEDYTLAGIVQQYIDDKHEEEQAVALRREFEEIYGCKIEGAIEQCDRYVLGAWSMFLKIKERGHV